MSKLQYVALDTFHHTGIGTVGPKDAPFDLADHDAKYLVEKGLVKVAKGPRIVTKAEIEAKTITSESVAAEKPADDTAKDAKPA